MWHQKMKTKTDGKESDKMHHLMGLISHYLFFTVNEAVNKSPGSDEREAAYKALWQLLVEPERTDRTKAIITNLQKHGCTKGDPISIAKLIYPFDRNGDYFGELAVTVTMCGGICEFVVRKWKRETRFDEYKTCTGQILVTHGVDETEQICSMLGSHLAFLEKKQKRLQLHSKISDLRNEFIRQVKAFLESTDTMSPEQRAHAKESIDTLRLALGEAENEYKKYESPEQRAHAEEPIDIQNDLNETQNKYEQPKSPEHDDKSIFLAVTRNLLGLSIDTDWVTPVADKLKEQQHENLKVYTKSDTVRCTFHKDEKRVGEASIVKRREEGAFEVYLCDGELVTATFSKGNILYADSIEDVARVISRLATILKTGRIPEHQGDQDESL